MAKKPKTLEQKWWTASKIFLAGTYLALGIGFNADEVPERYTTGAQTHNQVNRLEAKILLTSATFNKEQYKTKKEYQSQIDSLKQTTKYAKEEVFLKQKREEYRTKHVPYAVIGLGGVGTLLGLISLVCIAREPWEVSEAHYRASQARKLAKSKPHEKRAPQAKSYAAKSAEKDSYGVDSDKDLNAQVDVI